MFPALPWAIFGTEPPGLAAVASPSDMKIKLLTESEGSLDAEHPRRRAPQTQGTLKGITDRMDPGGCGGSPGWASSRTRLSLHLSGGFQKGRRPVLTGLGARWGGNGLQSRGESLQTPLRLREEQVYCPVGLHSTKRPDPVLPSL